jgi:small-conductance mechanosensitive channel
MPSTMGQLTCRSVPNSTMLENQVNNWTLHDNALRGAVDVGAAYGTNTRDVAHILTKIAEEHGWVPECLVLADSRH